jgi:histidinol-phosphate phosphatase family protein
MQPAIFIDRDGVIVENRPDYIRNWDDVLIYPQALQALYHINHSPYKIVIVTNQSAIGRGIISMNRAEAINRRLMEEVISHGGRIDRIYMCPHSPQDGCSCRKPAPGLLIQAAEELLIDLPRSVMIGDAWSDLIAGQAAGVQKLILVKTGRGNEQFLNPPPPGLISYLLYNNFTKLSMT